MRATTSPLEAARQRNLHTVHVDDTMTSVTFVVSWHDLGRPVQMTLLTPSLAVLTPSSMPSITTIGSSYIVMRVPTPAPGEWQVRVSAGDAKGPSGYTWGAHAETPIGLRLTAPAKTIGQQQFDVIVQLDDPSRLAQKVRFVGRASTPTISLDDIVAKNREALQRIKVRLKPDTPKIDPNFAKLPILDLQLMTKGEPSLFQSQVQKLHFAGRASKKATFESLVAGTSGVDVQVSGTTTGGFPFTRVARCDVHS